MLISIAVLNSRDRKWLKPDRKQTVSLIRLAVLLTAIASLSRNATKKYFLVLALLILYTKKKINQCIKINLMVIYLMAVFILIQCMHCMSECVSSFLTAHQHIIGYSVPWKGREWIEWINDNKIRNRKSTQLTSRWIITTQNVWVS